MPQGETMLVLVSAAAVAMVNPLHILLAFLGARVTRSKSWWHLAMAALSVGVLTALVGFALRAASGFRFSVTPLAGMFLGVALLSSARSRGREQDAHPTGPSNAPVKPRGRADSGRSHAAMWSGSLQGLTGVVRHDMRFGTIAPAVSHALKCRDNGDSGRSLPAWWCRSRQWTSLS